MALDIQRVHKLTDAMGRSRVLILGDIMLDEYLFGQVGRISPEAPVPVVEISSTRLLLGGAANVAANIKAIGDDPILIGCIGGDDSSEKLEALLSEKSITNQHLVTDPSRQTTIKTRIIAHSQQVVRADRENRHLLDNGIEQEILSRIQDVVENISAVIVSDYGKGVITTRLLEKVIALCLERDIFIAVDPKESNFPRYREVSLITPNHHEAGFAYGRRIVNDEDLYEVGMGLLKQLDARSILITRGAEGMSLFTPDTTPTHIPTFARHVYDVTGAGDTVIATFVSAVCGGASLPEAAVVANAGAGYTVGEVGTATVTLEQLTTQLERNIRNGNLVNAVGDA
jgi:D-beta-D-heptose 7-phosphate kinase/D-beta-D-heptose 1-phosphate adenosyltransferase